MPTRGMAPCPGLTWCDLSFLWPGTAFLCIPTLLAYLEMESGEKCLSWTTMMRTYWVRPIHRTAKEQAPCHKQACYNLVYSSGIQVAAVDQGCRARYKKHSCFALYVLHACCALKLPSPPLPCIQLAGSPYLSLSTLHDAA